MDYQYPGRLACTSGGDGKIAWSRGRANVGPYSPQATTLKSCFVVWFNKVVQSHPKELHVEIHNIPNGDHGDL